MITLEENGNYTFRQGDMPIFLDIVIEQSKIYNENKNLKISEINNPEDIIRANNNQIFPLYICMLFSALYLEAFIYDYCARKESQSLAKILDKLDPPNKWVIGTRLINGKGIDKSKKAYENLKNLFSLRNNLAHNKTKKIDITNKYNENNRSQDLLKPSECISIIKEILKELLIIDKDDIYTKFVISDLDKNIT